MGLLVIVFIVIVVGIAIVKSKQNTCKEFVEDEKEEIISEIVNDKTISDVDEIKKFKELLDAGTITQEEYDKKKKEILNL